MFCGVSCEFMEYFAMDNEFYSLEEEDENEMFLTQQSRYDNDINEGGKEEMEVESDTFLVVGISDYSTLVTAQIRPMLRQEVYSDISEDEDFEDEMEPNFE